MGSVVTPEAQAAALDWVMATSGGEGRDYLEWCRWLWNGLNEGGEWIVPRSQSVLIKHDGNLFFRGDDDTEFNVISLHFAAIGVAVVRDTLGPDDLTIQPIPVRIIHEPKGE